MDTPHRSSKSPSKAAAKSRIAFIAAIDRGDAVQAAVSYADDAWLIVPSAEPVQGRQPIEAFWRTGIDAGLSGVALEPQELMFGGSVAYEIGHYALRLSPPGGAAVVDEGNYARVHVQQPDGSWRWTLDVLSPRGAPAPIGRPPTSVRPGSKAREGGHQ